MEFNFINPGHITTTFETVAIMGEEFEINMFGDVSHLSLGRSQALSPHRPPVSSSHKNSRDKTTVCRNDWIPMGLLLCYWLTFRKSLVPLSTVFLIFKNLFDSKMSGLCARYIYISLLSSFISSLSSILSSRAPSPWASCYCP